MIKKQQNKKTMKTLAFSIGLAFLTLIANNLNAQDRGLFGMGKSSADYDYSSGESLMRQGEPNVNGGITNDSFGAPLGSGIAILLAAGAGYAALRRKRSRKNTTLLLACVLLLGFTQCKKEQIEPQGGKVNITLNVDNNNSSRAEVDPPHVNFVENDKILVGYDGKYVGTLTYTEYETGKYHFQGNIDASVEEPAQKLYFYFLGNMQDDASLTPGSTTSCTVNISDQTGYPTLPVISFSASREDFTGAGSYSANLHNKASLMKLNVTSASTRTICITGMNNKVTIDFGKVNETGDGLIGDTDQGFSYSVDETDGGLIKIKGSNEEARWVIVLPQAALAEGGEGTAYTNEETQRYKGNRPALDAINSNQYLNSGVDLTVNTADNSTTVDLSKLVYDYCAKNGETLTGTLSGDYKISIAAGAEVTLSNVNINGNGTWSSGNYAGLNCLGNATINLADGTTNSVKGFNVDYPGIYVPSNYTLTIQGTGTLNASSNGYGAGIGGGFKGDNTINCGNITISGGTVTATGGQYAAGIGSGGNGCSCGTITISGGTVTATGGQYAAGIGSGYNKSSCGAITISGGTVEATGGNDGAYGNAGVGIGSSDFSSCGAITIQNTVARVTATKGGSSATNSIGAGNYGTCGTVTIGGVEGAISDSPYTYEPPKALSAATAEDKGKVAGQDGKIYDNASAATSAGTTAVAKIIYIGTTGHATYSHGLALALTDEGQMAWEAAIDACSAKNTSTPVTDATWLLASKDQWNYMLGTNGAGSYTALRDGFSGITGASNLQSGNYWSSTEVDHFQALFYGFVSGHWYDGSKDDYSIYVRACLAF